IQAGRKKEGPDAGGLYKLGLAQPLPFSGRLGAQGGLRDLDAEAARVGRSAAGTAVTLEVLRLAYAYSGNRRKAAFVEARQRRFELVREYIAGREFLTPQRKAESRLVNNRLRVLAAEAVKTEAEFKDSFERLKLQAPLESAEYPDVETPWLSGARSLLPEDVLARAFARDPELVLRRIALKRAGLEVELARKEGLPEPALTASYEQAKTLETERSYGLGMSLGFPFWNGNRAGVESSRLRATAEERLLAFDERRLKTAVPAAVLRAEAARKTVQGYPEPLLAEVEGQLKEAEEGFRRGQVDLLTFLELDAASSETLGAALDSQTAFVERLAEVFELTQEPDAAAKLAGF
ncbi:MAG: hypothetical protein FD126_1002, partial [Elusimicrobia bacterium]